LLSILSHFLIKYYALYSAPLLMSITLWAYRSYSRAKRGACEYTDRSSSCAYWVRVQRTRLKLSYRDGAGFAPGPPWL